MAKSHTQKRSPIERPYTRAEVAKLLECSLRTVDNMATRGVLVCVKAGKRISGFTVASVRAYCEGRAS